MAGRGDLKESPKIDATHIQILRNGRWQPMFRPINPDRAFSGTNLAESFAEAYAEKYGVDVGLICCADGGTSLEQWKEGGLLYDNAVYQAKLASRTSTIAGVLWHQGEADCAPRLNVSYQVRFEKIMNAFRKDLDLYDVPFLLGGLGDFLADCPFDENLHEYKKVNEQLKNVAKENVMTGFVSATGLASKEDKLHFDAKALYEFGLRYFEEFERLRDPNKVFVDKSACDGVRSAMEAL
jgi:hypothetical protein